MRSRKRGKILEKQKRRGGGGGGGESDAGGKENRDADDGSAGFVKEGSAATGFYEFSSWVGIGVASIGIKSKFIGGRGMLRPKIELIRIIGMWYNELKKIWDLLFCFYFFE